MAISDEEYLFKRHNFSTVAALDLCAMIIGGEIGKGVARTVYEYLPNASNTVIKVEEGAQSFQNICEWETWLNLNGTGWGKRWLAPCIRISSSGVYLMQERTTPPGPGFKWPKQLPWVLTDRKKQNFGIFKGRLVCHDYGTLHVGMAKGAPLTRMGKAEWWDAKA